MRPGAWCLGRRIELVEDHQAALGRRPCCVAAPLPLTSFNDDVAALDRALERVPGPVVLAAHAYAGAVIAATRSDKVKALVYVAALAPDEGETVADVFTRGEPHPQAPKLAPDAHGLIYLPGTAFAAAFAQNAAAADLAVLAAVQRPISPACITVPVPRPLWKDRPAWFLVAEQDRMIVPGQSALHGRAHAGPGALACRRSHADRDRPGRGPGRAPRGDRGNPGRTRCVTSKVGPEQFSDPLVDNLF